MTYVDGYVLPVPTKKLAAYKKMAKEAGEVWMKHGALKYVECAGDDMNPGAEWSDNSFPLTVQAKKTETVIFAFIVYKSKAHRERVNKKVFADPYMNQEDTKHMELFDMKRMAYGGFEAIVEL